LEEYICEVFVDGKKCGKRFRTPEALMQHLKYDHGLEY